MKKKKKKSLATILVIALLILTVGGIYYFFGPKSGKISSKPDESSLQTFSRKLITEGQTLPEKTYTSTQLGVAFQYRDGYKIAEKGDKIFINDAGNPEDGEYVEVFSKNPGISLEQAIKDKILSSFSPCPASINTSDILFKNPSSKSVIYATIKPPSDLPFSDQTIAMLKTKCPFDYVQYSSNNYFKMDLNYPTKFIFLHSSGQYTILTNSGPWTESVNVVN